jgi:protein-tyrosine-phosphatase
MPDWMEDEQQEGVAQAKTGQVPNPSAARMAKPRRVVPERLTKAAYIRPEYARTFDILVAMKKGDGKRGPELWEEALEDLFKKYGLPFTPES